MAGYKVSVSQLAWCGQVTGTRRTKWAARTPPLVRRGPKFTSLDAVETAIVGVLAGVNQKAAPAAWLAVRQEVRSLLLSGSDDLWILMSASGPSHAVATSSAAAAERARDLREPVWLVSTGGAIRCAQQRFQQLLESRAGSSDVRRLRTPARQMP